MNSPLAPTIDAYDFQGEKSDLLLFETIANSLFEKGYSIHPNAMPPDLIELLYVHLKQMPSFKFKPAGIGRENQHTVNPFIRTDEVCWINGETEAGNAWLNWAASLQTYLNRRLFLGLFSFESHFAHYAPGDFYKKHQDAFKGEANRILSVVVYLNPEWVPDDGGELVIYTGQDDVIQNSDQSSVRVTPGFGTLVVFLSEDFPHEVLRTQRDRYSIAGWFRLNSSNSEKADPPR